MPGPPAPQHPVTGKDSRPKKKPPKRTGFETRPGESYDEHIAREGKETYARHKKIEAKQTKENAMSASKKQALLAKLGYAIDVDGMWGPQSQAAWEAYHKRIPATYWNRHAPRSNEYVTKTPTPKSSPLGTRNTAPVQAPAPSGGPAPKGGGRKPAGKIGIPDLPPGVNLGGFNPEQYATSLTNMAYAGPIAELRRQQALTTAQGDEAKNDITSWFDQVMRTANQGRQENADTAAAGLRDYDSATQGLLAAFGGGANIAASEIGAAASAGRAGLQGLGQVQGAFDTRMKDILSAQKADALLREGRSREQNLFELSGKLSDLLAERGSALQKNRLDAQNVSLQRESQALQNETARQNMLLAQQLLPAQLEEANLRNAGLAAQNRAAGLSYKQAKLDYDTTQAQFEHWLAQNKGASSQFAQLDPGERSDLADRLFKSVVNPATGIPSVNPDKAFGIIGNLLKAANLSGAQAAAFRRQVMKWIYPGLTFGPKGNPVAKKKYTQ